MVQVYRNLRYRHKTIWSVRSKKSRLVVARLTVVAVKAAQFKVSEKGRSRVLKEKRKNVHAFVEGSWIRDKNSLDNLLMLKKQGKMKQVSYNPYKGGNFVEKSTGKAVADASCNCY